MSNNISKVNKFRINYKKPRSQCAFSSFRYYRHYGEEKGKMSKKIDKEEFINIEDKNKNKDEIINKNDIIEEEEDEILEENYEEIE